MWFSHLTNILFYGYYYHYRELRKQCKVLVDSSNYIDAKTKLDSAITEHNTKYGITVEQKRDFNYGERIMMEHTQLHLNTVIDKNDPSFLIQAIDGTTTTGHHSDIVKDALVRIPKSDYSD